MRKFAAMVLYVSCVPAFAQIGGMPGMPGSNPAQQAQQAMQQAQASAQAAMQAAQFASQAAMLQARGGNSAMLAGQAAMFQGAIAGQAAMVHNMGQAMAMQGQIANYEAILRSQSSLSSMEAMQLRSVQLTNVAMLNSSVLHNQMVRMSAISRSRSMLQAAQQSGQMPAETTDVPPMPTPSPMMIRPTFGNPLEVEKPNFSVESGKVAAGTKVKIKTDTHYSAVYYTTDGWTPTTESTKYTGPITINDTTHLQTIAVGPNMMRSQVNHADYTVEGSKPKELQPVVVPADGVLRLGTPLRLETSGPDVNSQTASVGDKMTLVLDQEVKFGDTVIAAKGSKVEAVLTIADAGGHGAPGDLVFEVSSMDVGGKKIALFASETMESQGKEAIKSGIPVNAFVAADVSVKP